MGREWAGQSRRHPGGKPAEGASLPTSTDSSNWAAASLAPGGNPANYQTQTWDLHFYEMLTEEANLFSLKKRKRKIKMDRERKSSYQYILIQSNLGHFSFHKKVLL